MNKQEELNTKLFTDFDGTFDGVLARVMPVAANYTSEWAGSAARYECRIKIRYNKELMSQLEEGMMLAVKNFRGQSKAATDKHIQRYTVMVVSKVWPLHYGLGGVSDSHYYPLQLEVIEQSVPDWDTDDQSTMMVHLNAIPINYDLIVDSNGHTEFRKGFSYPLIGSKTFIINRDLVDEIYNSRVKKAIGFNKNFTSPDPRKDPRIGTLRMFMESQQEIPLYVDLYKLVRYHFGVFSFTGGGKSNLVSNILRRMLYHTKDTKIVLFDVSCEYPFLLCDIFSDPKIRSRIVLEDEPASAAQFSHSIVKPRDFEEDATANEALKKVFDRGIVTYYNRPLEETPTFGSLLDQMRDLRTDNTGKPTYQQAIDDVAAFVSGWMSARNKNEQEELDDAFIDNLDQQAQDAMAKFSVHEKSGLYAWGTTRSSLKDVLARAKSSTSTGVTVKDLIAMLRGPERVICISIAEPDILRDLVIRLTSSALKHRRKAFETKPQILFVFDEAQEFIPSNAGGQVGYCSAAVERLLRQGRKYGLGGAVATQRIAYLNTNIMQQLHTFFVGTLPRPYDRTVVSSSFQIDLSILDKTLEFPPGSWLLSSYIATGLDNVPVFIKADNSEDVITAHLAAMQQKTGTASSSS